MMLTGYFHPLYAESLAEFGTPTELPRCGGWVLERPIVGTPLQDATGCYPLFTCQDWSQLQQDLENVGQKWVSVSLVADPFGNYTLDDLRRCFDLVIPFKDHFIVDLQHPLNSFVSKHHRYYARRSLSSISVEICLDPILYLEEWTNLYATLARRHDLKGIKAFSKQVFAAQLTIPGIVMFRAVYRDHTVGIHLWFIQKDVGYSHLAAFSDEGYTFMASYALYWFAIHYFAEKLSGRVSWLDLGAGAGTKATDMNGLTQFKRGWSTGTRVAYFCGRIFDKRSYEEIVSSKRIVATDYFPAYRNGEFR